MIKITMIFMTTKILGSNYSLFTLDTAAGEVDDVRNSEVHPDVRSRVVQYRYSPPPPFPSFAG